MSSPVFALVAFLALAQRTTAQQSAKACPRDASVKGYSSIVDINSDMQAELLRISNGNPASDSYTFRLCPNMVFDASTPLLPVLSNSLFVCGSDGNRDNNCIILGGSEQVRIENSQIENYTIDNLSFMGLSFADFRGNDAMTGTSIAALASAPTSARFMNVAFTVSVASYCDVTRTAHG
jgi:hypothetical protein